MSIENFYRGKRNGHPLNSQQYCERKYEYVRRNNPGGPKKQQINRHNLPNRECDKAVPGKVQNDRMFSIKIEGGKWFVMRRDEKSKSEIYATFNGQRLERSGNGILFITEEGNKRRVVQKTGGGYFISAKTGGAQVYLAENNTPFVMDQSGSHRDLFYSVKPGKLGVYKFQYANRVCIESKRIPENGKRTNKLLIEKKYVANKPIISKAAESTNKSKGKPLQNQAQSSMEELKDAIKMIRNNKRLASPNFISKFWSMCTLHKSNFQRIRDLNLTNTFIKEAKSVQNRITFTQNHKLLNEEELLKRAEIEHVDVQNPIGSGTEGKICNCLNKKKQLTDFVIKIPNEKEQKHQSGIKKELTFANEIRNAVKGEINNDNFANVYPLKNTALPIQAKDNNSLIIQKVNGKDADKAIDGRHPAYAYSQGIQCAYVIDSKQALSFELQGVMLANALNKIGFVNTDDKPANRMITQDGRTIMIDAGGIEKIGCKINVCSPFYAPPEIFDAENFKIRDGAIATTAATTWISAMIRPEILLGSIANKYLPTKKYIGTDESGMPLYSQIPAQIFQYYYDLEQISEMETRTRWQKKKQQNAEIQLNKLQNEYLRQYEQNGYTRPSLPKDFTKSQKLRYMYYHLGFKRTQDAIDQLTGKTPYLEELIHSFALLQTFSTEINPKYRISTKTVEDFFTHLVATYDNWNNATGRPKKFRIDGVQVKSNPIQDMLLPKNDIPSPRQQMNSVYKKPVLQRRPFGIKIGRRE